jgi:hypothetical protein
MQESSDERKRAEITKYERKEIGAGKEKAIKKKKKRKILNEKRHREEKCDLKGPCHEIFDLWFFLSNNPVWVPDSRVKAFTNTASNSRSYSTKPVPQRSMTLLGPPQRCQ